jgi:hypothetical protein
LCKKKINWTFLEKNGLLMDAGMRPTSRFFGFATEFSAFHRKTTGKSSSANEPVKKDVAQSLLQIL